MKNECCSSVLLDRLCWIYHPVLVFCSTKRRVFSPNKSVKVPFSFFIDYFFSCRYETIIWELNLHDKIICLDKQCKAKSLCEEESIVILYFGVVVWWYLEDDRTLVFRKWGKKSWFMSLSSLSRGIMELGCQYWLYSVVVLCEMVFFVCVFALYYTVVWEFCRAKLSMVWLFVIFLVVESGCVIAAVTFIWEV